ncbi:MAG TPA: VCBS repeat-containing protein [Cellvibrionaceae bacterium]
MASSYCKLFTLIFVLFLTACNGASNLQLTGTISQLNGELILSDGNGVTKTFSENGKFNFAPTQYKTNTAYAIEVVKQPLGYVCQVLNGKGVFANTDVSNVEVNCKSATAGFTLSGQAFNLTSPVTLVNDRNHATTINASGPFSFSANNYKSGESYLVSISSSGLKQTCTLSNHYGAFANQNINSVQLKCMPRTDLVTVTAGISGLKGTLVLDVSPEESRLTVKNATGEQLTQKIAELPLGTPFRVAINNQPEDQTCDILNGDGIVTSNSLTSVFVICKDTTPKYALTGSISGDFGLLQVSDGLGASLTLEGDKPFKFGPYKSGSQYAISVVSQPIGANCSVYNGKGALEADVNDVKIICEPAGVFLAGTAAGISAPITLNDGNNNQITVKQDGVFYFTAKYAPSTPYTVAVENSPAGSLCEVFYGKGVFAKQSVADVQVVCHAKAIPISACNSPSVISAQNSFSLTNKLVNMGEGLGLGGLSVFDANINGYPEILFGQGVGFGRPKQFSILEYRPEEKGYGVLCSSNPFNDSIARVLPFKNDKYRAASLIALEQGEIQIFNHTAGTRVQTLQTGMAINDVAIGDVDNDGRPDIAVLSETALAVYDANTFHLKQKLNQGGKSLAVGKFTQASQYQLAINRGLLLQLGTEGFQTLWDYSTVGFGDTFVTAGDIDGDGLDEIVAADRWYAIRAFKVSNRSVLWDKNPGSNISFLRVFDTNNDGISEVLYADTQHGSTYILKGIDAVQLQKFANINGGGADIYVGNLDGDANLEIIRSTGLDSTALDQFDVIDLNTQTTEWISRTSVGSFHAMAAGDLNGDKVADYVYMTGEGSSGAVVTAINGLDNSILWVNKDITNRTFYRTASLAIGDIDNDGALEVVVGNDNLRDGHVYLLDGKTGVSDKEISLETASPITSLAIADIDGDGTKEIIAGAGVASTGSSGAKVHIIDGPTFTLERTLPRLTTGFGDVTSIELIKPEASALPLIAALRGKVYLLNPAINSIAATADEYTAITATESTLLAANANGKIFSIAADGAASAVATLCISSVASLHAINNNEIAFVCDNKLGLYRVDNKEIVWQSAQISASLGAQDAMTSGRSGGEDVLLIGGDMLYFFKRISATLN